MKIERFMTREQRKARDADFKRREQPRLLWASTQEGTAVRTTTGKHPYKHQLGVSKVKHKPTEAEDNAAGRRIRRRTNKALVGWRPYAQR